MFNVIREQDIHDQLQQLQDHINGREVQDDEILISNLIINIGRSHWVTLVIAYQNGNYYGYYTNSTGGNVPDWLNTLMVNDVPVPVHNVLADQEGNVLVQQRDGYNCGLWVLENTRSINQILQQNNNLGEQGRGVLDEMRNSLTLNVPGLNNIVDQDNLRNEQYFQNLRREISREFRNTGTNVGHDRDNNPQIRGAIRLQNQNEIRELLLNFLELQYPTRGIWQQQPLGGGGGVPILSIGDSDNRELLKELEQPKNDKREARQEAEERKCEGIKQNKNLILNASDANKTVNDARLSGIKSFESQGVSTMLSDANVSGVSTRLGRY